MTRAQHVLETLRRVPRSKARLGLAVAALAASAAAVATGVATSIGGFGGPLFGLTAGKPGELWVADSSVGIIPIRRGETGTPIALPGATDVSVAGPANALGADGRNRRAARRDRKTTRAKDCTSSIVAR